MLATQVQNHMIFTERSISNEVLERTEEKPGAKATKSLGDFKQKACCWCTGRIYLKHLPQTPGVDPDLDAEFESCQGLS